MKKFTILMGLFLATMVTGQAMAQTVTLTMEDVNKIEQHIVGLNTQIEALEKEIAELKSQAKIKKNSDTVLEDFDVGEGFVVDAFYVKSSYAHIELDVTDPAIKKIICRVKSADGQTIASGSSSYLKLGWTTQLVSLDTKDVDDLTVTCKAQ